MKNITLSADDHLIEGARETAKARHTTLNQMFRDWLDELESRKHNPETYDSLMQRIGQFGVSSGGRKFTREEMNER